MRGWQITLLLAVLLTACSQESQTSSQKRDCDSLKGSSKIMAMNCK